eukprot:PhM_4_TR18675/c0_g1_i2/m.71074/K17533/MAP3K19, YSK4; mitogen-activated protein kinase kinase kinase 19
MVSSSAPSPSEAGLFIPDLPVNEHGQQQAPQAPPPMNPENINTHQNSNSNNANNNNNNNNINIQSPPKQNEMVWYENEDDANTLSEAAAVNNPDDADEEKDRDSLKLSIRVYLGVIVGLIAVCTVVLAWMGITTARDSTTDVARQLRHLFGSFIQVQFTSQMRTPIVASQRLQFEIGRNLIEPEMAPLVRGLYTQHTSWPYNAHYVGLTDAQFYGYSVRKTQYADTKSSLSVFREFDVWYKPNATALRSTFAVNDTAPFLYTDRTATRVYATTERPWFVQAVQNKDTTPSQYSSIYMFATDAMPGITATSVLWDKNGNVIGVMGIDLLLTFLNDMVKANLVASRGVGYIVEADGTLVASSIGDVGASDVRYHSMESASNIVRESSEAIGFDGSYRGVDITQFDMSFDGVAHWVDVVPLFVSNLQWYYVSVVPTSEFLQAVEEGQRDLIITVCLVGGASLIFSVVLTVLLQRPIRALADDLHNVSTMELEKIDLKAPLSTISEVASMQLNFRLTVQHLIEYRAFMPQAVLLDDASRDDELVAVEDDGGDNENGDRPNTEQNKDGEVANPNDENNSNNNTAGTLASSMFRPRPGANNNNEDGRAISPSSPTTHRRVSMFESSHSSDISHFSRGKVRRVGSDKDEARLMRLRETGFRVFDATFVCVSIPKTTSSLRTMQLQTTVPKILECIEQHGGLILFLNSDRVVASWNGFRPCPTHQASACGAAHDIRRRCPGLCIAVTGSVVHVGYVGSQKHRTPVIVGEAMDDMELILDLAAALFSRVFVTDRVARKVDSQYDFAAVDHIRGSERAVTIYEMLAQSRTNQERPQLQKLCEPYKLGFSHFLTRNYDEAVKCFSSFIRTSIDLDDVLTFHSIRLLKLACHFRDSQHPKYLRLHNNTRWNIYEADAENVALPDEVNELVGGRGRQQPTSPGTAANALSMVTSFRGNASEQHLNIKSISNAVNSVRQHKSVESGSSEESESDAESDVVGNTITNIDREARDSIMNVDDTMDTSMAAKSGRLDDDTAPAPLSVADRDGPGGLSRSGKKRSSRRQRSAMALMSSTSDGFIVNNVHYHKSEKLLGKGATAAVHLGMADDGSLVAIKCCQIPERKVNHTLPGSPSQPEKDDVDDVLSEIEVLAKLRHDNVVSYLGCAVVNAELVIVTEFVSGGSLQSVLETFGRIPERSCRRYLQDVLHGLAYLHHNDIVHRDIKPHNVLLQIDGQCKLSDFGTAVKSSLTEGNVAGTPLYMAPEACSGSAGKASDVWSVGVMTLQLLLGRIPYTTEQLGNPFYPPRFVYRLGRDEALVPPIPEGEVSDAAASFVRACLHRDPRERADVETLMQHTFML